MEYFRCHVAQSLPGLSFDIFIYKREINNSNLSFYLVQVGTHMLDFDSCYVYI